jgi:hypothetical protein
MPAVKEIIDSQLHGTCGTATVRGLSLQIIAEMNLIIPNVLVNCEDLNIVPASLAVNSFLQPAAKDALRRAIKARANAPLRLTSAYRTVAQQHLLYSWYTMASLCGIGLAAKPGLSNHEDGLAIDTPDFDDWRTALETQDWDWLGDTTSDEVHFTYIGSGVRDDIGNIGVRAFQQLWNKNNPDDQIEAEGLFGPETAKRLNQSPADGFPTVRLLKLTTPPMQGEDIKTVQQALIDVGLLNATGNNGIYDATTKAAVEKFQNDKGLTPDGKVGAQTRKALGI